MSIRTILVTAVIAVSICACASNPGTPDGQEPVPGDTATNEQAVERAEADEPATDKGGAEVESKEQFRRDMELICSDPPGEVMSAKPEQRAGALGSYWEENTSSDGAEKLLEALAKTAPSEKTNMMLWAAKDAGIDDCPFARKLFGEPPEEPSGSSVIAPVGEVDGSGDVVVSGADRARGKVIPQA